MTGVQYVEYILDNDWEPSVAGRVHNVPKPDISREKEDSTSRIATSDRLVVQDGGTMPHKPASVGYLSETKTTRVSISVRTEHSRERFEGARDANNDAEDWGGLYGEVKRILQERRKGHKEYDIVVSADWNDISGNFPKNYWRGSWEVKLEEVASLIELPEIT